MKPLHILGGIAAVLFAVIIFSANVSALSLRIAPLSYETTLGKGESKKGVVDISNSDTAAQVVKLEVQAFRQIDDDGSLQYYPDERVATGIHLDYNEVEIGPLETLRLAFSIDGKKLPEGDVFAVIFASTTPIGASSTVQSVRVGTLLMIQNGTPSRHSASVSELSAPFFQIGDALQAQFAITNTADPALSTGFFPSVKIDLMPYTSTTSKGPLVFGGRTRPIEYRQPGNYFGFILVRASVGTESRSRVVFAMTGYWRWLAPLVGVVLASIFYAWLRRRKKQTLKKPKKVTRIPVH